MQKYIFSELPSYDVKMRGGDKRRMIAYTCFFKEVFERFMGRSSLMVLEYQLSKRLSGANPYELLLDNPQDFHRALASILGAEGSFMFLKLIFKHIIDGYALTGWNPDEFARAFISGGDEARRILLSLLKKLPIEESG